MSAIHPLPLFYDDCFYSDVEGAVAEPLVVVAGLLPVVPRRLEKYQTAAMTRMSTMTSIHTQPRPRRCGSTRISAIRSLLGSI
jgi:hypothetical protein